MFIGGCNFHVDDVNNYQVKHFAHMLGAFDLKQYHCVMPLTVSLCNAHLAILAFTKGRDQLDPVDVEKTREIANVRIHVERVIGLLCRKFTILSGILPIDFLTCTTDGPENESVPMIDRIITVCAALINLCPGIVLLD